MGHGKSDVPAGPRAPPLARTDRTLNKERIINSNISRRRQSALSEGGSEYVGKRAELIRIAARLFREKGYRATKLNDVAVEAGIDRASLYYYIGSKEELLREVIEELLGINLQRAEEISADASLDTEAKLRRIFEMLMLSYEEHYPQMYVYIQEQMHHVTQDDSAWAREILRSTRRFEAIVVNLIGAGVQDGSLRPDIPIKVASNAIFGMYNWTHRWFTPDGALSAADLAKAFNTIFFEGIKAPKA